MGVRGQQEQSRCTPLASVLLHVYVLNVVTDSVRRPMCSMHRGRRLAQTVNKDLRWDYYSYFCQLQD